MVEFSYNYIEFQKDDNNVVKFNPCIDSHFLALKSYIEKFGFDISYIVHAVFMQNEVRAYQFDNDKYFGVYSIFAIYKYILPSVKNNVLLSVVGSGFSVIHDNESLNQASIGMLAAIRTIAHEYLNVKTCLLDISVKEDILNTNLVPLLIDDDLHSDEKNLAIRGGYLWEEFYEPKNFNASSKKGVKDLIGAGDVILITGGLGKIASQLVYEISKNKPVKFILIGRSKPSIKNLSDFDQLKSNGSEVHYIQCDVSSKLETDNLFEHVYKNHGKIDGVIHTAGLLPRERTQSSFKTLDNFLSAKVGGALNLLNNLSEFKDVKFFVMTSSLASIMGDIGRFEYSVANNCLDMISQIQNKNITNILSINLPGWLDKETSHDALNRKNNLMNVVKNNILTDQEGRKLLYNLTNSGTSGQIIISKYGLDELKTFIFRKHQFDDVNFSFQQESDSDLHEDVINSAFKEILGDKEIDKDKSFFEMGADSLSVVRLINIINKQLRINLTVQDVFKEDSINKLSKYSEILLNHNSNEALVGIEDGAI